MTRKFDRVAASLYLQEAVELVDALLFRLGRLEEAATRWLAANDIADQQGRTTPDDFEVETFNRALHLSVREQSTMFDEVEAFLAAWARLSLLFWPTPLRSSPSHDFTIGRGALLVKFLELSNESPLADRRLRNAWMHTDERFDAAWQQRTLGNRQQFVRRAGVESAVKHAVRVLDVESLTIHFRDADGSVVSQPLSPLRSVLQDLLSRRQEAFRIRLAELPDHTE